MALGCAPLFHAKPAPGNTPVWGLDHYEMFCAAGYPSGLSFRFAEGQTSGRDQPGEAPAEKFD